MRVDIWSDLVCPWCYIGTTRFHRALEDFEHRDRVEVVYRSFELDPTREPGRTEPVTRMLTDRYGPQGAGMDDQVAELARADGLGYRTDREVGSTLDAHRLLHLAARHGLQRRLLAALFEGHFAEGASLFTPEALVGFAERVGLDPDEARRVLHDPDAYLEPVRADEQEAARLGAGGVPFFVVDGRYGVSGAQPVETFARALRAAWDERERG
ncbi:DsbA family oxidoreductase [Saccharothrix algeriensis]|uniref:DsbA family dithiol-disulfide isomerase n=1 Tax=Saccharothrix algeriensis TaxID=173560 RepID=A0A8T8I1D0_9PSEU|nr:DsbA family oxidoreductase [Saccharothrix algeriensis]MBM7810289.1 putative DsbA family dithiol-disulfide isomerase [Saccharothrix algeriensis]QTR04448.1 DsbA family oxidoreductase [Saccharothrix algeriensis]